MKQLWRQFGWIPATMAGGALFAAGFALFLAPNDMNSGGISGLAMVVVHLLGRGSVGTVMVIFNLPLFLVGGLRIGRRFFLGSLLGMFTSSTLIDLLSTVPFVTPEPLIGALYGSTICGLGLGLVFMSGTSTGGSDILVRLLKLRYRNVPIGQISMTFDACVVVLTGLVFGDLSKALYSGVAVYICGKVVDAVIYRFDYSKVAMIVSAKYEQIALAIYEKLDRGATFLQAEGSYTGRPTKVVLVGVKRQQLADLKALVVEVDPNAFVIVQEAHQILGEGFSRYSRDAL